MALTSVEIQKAAANFLEFQKGRMLSDQNAVTDVKCDSFWRGEVLLKTQVEEEGNVYQTKVKVINDRPSEYSCTCTYFHRDQGICRHLAASLFHYQIYYQEGGFSSVTTSLGGKKILKSYQERQLVAYDMKNETIFLEPRLILHAQKAELEFYIGDRRIKDRAQYKLKDLRDFCICMRDHKERRYGKQISFIHLPNVLEPFSRKIADLIIKQMTEYDYFHMYPSISQNTFEKIASIFLKDSVADEWFSLLEGSEITVDTGMEKRVCHVVKNDPVVQVEFRKKGRDGVEISIPGSWTFIYGLNALYAVGESVVYICSSAYSNDMKEFFQMSEEERILKQRQVVFQERDFQSFCSVVLPYLEEKIQIQEYGIRLEEMRPQNLTSSFFLESPDGINIICRFRQSYGDFSFHPLKETKFPENIRRNIRQEKQVHAVIKDYFTQRDAEGNLVIYDDEQAVCRLLKEGVTCLKSIGEVYVSDKVKQIKINPLPEITIGITLKSELLDLKVDSGELSGEELLAILHSYQEKKKWHRLKNGEFVELVGTSLEKISELAEGLHLSNQQIMEKEILLPKYRALYINAVFRDGEENLLARSEYFSHMIKQMEIPLSTYEIPHTLCGIMKEYQKQGFQWIKILKMYGFGGILADDMGLGKTLQVISFLLSEKEDSERKGIKLSPSLIVCPASLIYNWESEFSRFAPEVKVVAVVGNVKERKEIQRNWGCFDVLITSYDLLRKDYKSYKEMDFSTMVIDEAQYIKNHVTQNARTVKSIQASFRLALTGTPVENRLSELWSIFDFLMPGFLYTYNRFRMDFELPIVRQEEENVLKRLHQMTGPFIMRRLKRDVLKELPEKLEEIVYSRMEGTQRYLYQAAVMELKDQLKNETEESFRANRISILAQLMRLRQICCDPSLCFEDYGEDSAKLNTCMELVSRAILSGHKILLFSQFTSMLEIIENRLKKEDISYYKLTGNTSKEDRAKMVEAFQKDHTSVFLISLKAGGTGLNLTAADIVIHYDPWWNMAVQNQATDRTHRIGQNKIVTVYRLITKDTIEDNILKLQESKKSLAQQVIHADGNALSTMNHKDLLDILG